MNIKLNVNESEKIYIIYNFHAEAERRQQRNRRQQQREMQNRGMLRHCTYFDAQFSRDGSHYALMCLGPSVPYVTLHKIILDDIDNAKDNNEGSGSSDEPDRVPLTAQKTLKDSSYSFELIALIENNTRLQVIFIFIRRFIRQCIN